MQESPPTEEAEPKSPSRGWLSRIHTFQALRHRDFRLLWMGQLSVSMGLWMDNVARSWLIYSLTGSALDLGFAAAARGIPMLIFGPIAGVVADRYNKKIQLACAQGASVLLNFLLASLVLFGHVQPWHVYLTGFFAGLVQAFQMPARFTLVNDIVGPKDLLNAVALSSVAQQLSRSIGPAIAGVLIAGIGVHGSYYVQAGMYLVATMWTLQIRMPPRPTVSARTREPMLKSLTAGLAYVRATPHLRALILLALGPLTLGMCYSSMMPLFAQDILGGGAKLQGLLLTCVGIGAFIGAVIVASIPRNTGYGRGVALGAAAFLIAVMLFSRSHWVPASLVLGAVIGLFTTTYQTQNQTLLQLAAPDKLRGRVLSIYALNVGLMPMGALLAGALAHWIGAPNAVTILTGAGLVLVFCVALLTPGFWSWRVRVAASGEVVQSASRG